MQECVYWYVGIYTIILFFSVNIV